MNAPTPARPAVFLDRDGTLIEDCGYLADPAELRVLPGVIDGLIAMERAGYARVIITNQSGIGRGKYPASAFEATQRELERQLQQGGASIDATYHCPHAPGSGCTCRKPGTALHREAMATLNLDAARSWFVGDHIRDLEPAAELGGRTMLVLTGQGATHLEAARLIGAEVATDLQAGSAILPRYL